MKKRRFVHLPRQISQADTFRVGTIGHVFPEDIDALITAVAGAVDQSLVSRCLNRVLM